MNTDQITNKINDMFEDARKGVHKYGPSGRAYYFNKKVVNGVIVETYDFLGLSPSVEVPHITGTKHLSVGEAVDIILAAS